MIKWKIAAKSGQVFDNGQGSAYFNQRNRGVDGIASFAENRLLRKKHKEDLLSSLQKQKQRKQ